MSGYERGWLVGKLQSCTSVLSLTCRANTATVAISRLDASPRRRIL